MAENKSDMKAANAAWMESSERAAFQAGKQGVQL